MDGGVFFVMMKVNDIIFETDGPLLKVSYNISETVSKEYLWRELKTILSRIPGEYVILYETGSIWNTQTENKYLFDTFSETEIADFNSDDNSDNQYIFSVISYNEQGPVNVRDYIKKLDKMFNQHGFKQRDLIVEYFNLILIKSSMVEY